MKSRSHYDLVFITNLPSFYKVNLYNEIAKERKVYVIYTGHANQGRNEDFVSQKPGFDYCFLKTRSRIFQSFEVLRILSSLSYRFLFLSGWDHPTIWVSAFTSTKSKNIVVSESSSFESATEGLKGIVKRLFLSRISKAFVSGRTQAAVFKKLQFKGETIITKGVGVFNYVPQPIYTPRQKVTKLIYVGRLIAIKQVGLLIEYFKNRPDLELHIAGFGVLEEELKAKATSNVIFHGAVPNKKLSNLYQQMDAFILPSKKEPWGLVVEEALNNGLPVIVSNRVGCIGEVVNEKNGLVFQFDSISSLDECVTKMCEVDFHNQLRKNISKLDFSEIERQQVRKYLI